MTLEEWDILQKWVHANKQMVLSADRLSRVADTLEGLQKEYAARSDEETAARAELNKLNPVQEEPAAKSNG